MTAHYIAYPIQCVLETQRKEKANIGQSDVNMSPLALPCSRTPLMQGDGNVCYYSALRNVITI